ncbi:hypothetical protein ZIOFF_052983 [Zingiber officinale]|uniref:Uncharacterized protein n=1 Tax=Zingiber officinale TaxID=94328 RepID=A0A8J5FDS8_ZINOF|nr:hypothetical protein ZIOFF_052983 [Zingiber officinale]
MMAPSRPESGRYQTPSDSRPDFNRNPAEIRLRSGHHASDRNRGRISAGILAAGGWSAGGGRPEARRRGDRWVVLGRPVARRSARLAHTHYDERGERGRHAVRNRILLPLLGSSRFHVLFHSPMGVLFTFSSRYYFAIGHPGVFSLARWSLLIHTGFHVPHATRVRALSLACPWIQQQFERLTYSGISGSMLIFNSPKQ